MTDSIKCNTSNQQKLIRLLNLTGWYFDDQITLSESEVLERASLYKEIKELLK